MKELAYDLWTVSALEDHDRLQNPVGVAVTVSIRGYPVPRTNADQRLIGAPVIRVKNCFSSDVLLRVPELVPFALGTRIAINVYGPNPPSARLCSDEIKRVTGFRGLE